MPGSKRRRKTSKKKTRRKTSAKLEAKETFSFEAPARVTFGAGAVGAFPELIRGFGNRALVVSDPGITKAGIVDRVLGFLRDASVSADAFTNVEPNPSVETVEAAHALYRKSDAGFVVSVGGGSSMDVAKVVSVLAAHGGSVRDYEGIGKVPGPVVPTVAIPTTAGTGSEVTVFAVITDRQRKFKMTVGSPYLVPHVAICDPELSLSMPKSLTAATGMDALTHGIECYINKVHNPIAKTLALESIRMIAGALRTAYTMGTDLQARSTMLLGSTMAGMAFTRTRLGNVHAMSHPLGAFFDVPHGVANAILLPYIMEWNLPFSRETYPHIAAAMGEPVAGLSPERAAEVAVDAVKRLSQDVGIPERLRTVGVTRDAIPGMSQDAMKSGNVLVNPRPTTYEDIVQLFETAY
ncbi:MAG: iron-containing alcohol dehydrogenase [bacterium]